MKVWIAWLAEVTYCGCGAAHRTQRPLGIFRGKAADVFEIYDLRREIYLGEQDHEGQTSWVGRYTTTPGISVKEMELKESE